MTDELKTLIDFIRYGASRFAAAGLTFGHGHDNALDEATQLVLHALHLPHDLKPAYGAARLVADEKKVVLDLFERRIRERKPACYLTGEAWFAELLFKCDERALVPRSPIAELIVEGYEPWRNGRPLNRVLDLCTGGGCIAIASAHYLPDALVDGVDISPKALSLANENAERLLVADARHHERAHVRRHRRFVGHGRAEGWFGLDRGQIRLGRDLQRRHPGLGVSASLI